MKKDKLPNPISILILTLLTTIIWISLNIYRAITVGPAPSVSQTTSQSLVPTLNKDSISKIESSIFLNDSQIPQTATNPSATTTPTATPTPSTIPTPEATSSAIPQTTP